VRAQEGKIPPFFVLRSEAEVAATQQELVNARRDVELSLLQLQTVMGISPASQIEITDALSYEPSAPFLQQLAPVSQNATTDLAALLRLAERQRPELQAAEQQVLAAQAETSAVRSAYRPQINAFGMGDVMKMQGEKMTGGVAFGVVASVSIFDGGQKRARVATAEAERRRQEAERQRLILQVGQEVATSMLNLRTGELNIQTADAALKSAQEDYRVARIRYESGRSTLVEVLDALAARVRAEGNVVQALFTYNTARDQLRRAVGEDPARASDGELKR
jgi:outer membrane protein TolC